MKEKMRSFNRHRSLYLFGLMVLLSNGFLVLYLLYRYQHGNQMANPFFSSVYRWNDFTNPVLFAENRRAFEAPQANSPPFLALVAYFYSSISRYLHVDIKVLYLISWFAFELVVGIAVFSMTWQRLKRTSIYLMILLAVSFPMLYCFDRGNMVFFAAMLIAVFMMLYQHKHYYMAAIALALAAALKIYPAILGIVFLADKRYREAVVCAACGVVVTLFSFVYLQEGIVEGIQIWLERTQVYSLMGNRVLRWLHDDKSSLYQLWIVPRMLSVTPLTDISEIPEFVKPAKYALTVLLAFSILYCLRLTRNHDRVFLMTMMMIGYPIESGVYNLVLAIVPLVYWCTMEDSDIFVPIAGGLLIGCQSWIVLSNAPYVTLQALVHPMCVLLLVLYVIVLRIQEVMGRKMVKE